MLLAVSRVPRHPECLKALDRTRHQPAGDLEATVQPGDLAAGQVDACGEIRSRLHVVNPLEFLLDRPSFLTAVHDGSEVHSEGARSESLIAGTTSMLGCEARLLGRGG